MVSLIIKYSASNIIEVIIKVKNIENITDFINDFKNYIHIYIIKYSQHNTLIIFPFLIF